MAEPQVWSTAVKPILATEMLGIGGDGGQGLGRGLEQEVVDDGLVLVGNISNGSRQGEYDVVVLNRQEIGLAISEPLPGHRALTLWTMAVTTRVVGDLDG